MSSRHLWEGGFPFRQRPVRPAFGAFGPVLRAGRGILGASFGLNLNPEGER